VNVGIDRFDKVEYVEIREQWIFLDKKLEWEKIDDSASYKVEGGFCA